MTTDDLRTQAERAAAVEYMEFSSDDFETRAQTAALRAAFVDGVLWHAAQQPSREELARVIAARYWSDNTGDVEPWSDLTATEQENVVENCGADAIAQTVRDYLTGDESNE